MEEVWFNELRDQLLAKQAELDERLDRISANLQRPLDADSKERAAEMESQEVVDALGNEAREELKKIKDALGRMDSGGFGTCQTCAEQIDQKRLSVHPYAENCIDCASLEESRA